MKFLLDVHISTRIASALTDDGHDVVRAALAFPTALDIEVLAIAVSEQRILVTEDSDFSDLIFVHEHAAPTSLIYIRCSAKDQPAMAERVIEILGDARLQGHIVVLTPTSARYRALPNIADDLG